MRELSSASRSCYVVNIFRANDYPHPPAPRWAKVHDGSRNSEFPTVGNRNVNGSGVQTGEGLKAPLPKSFQEELISRGTRSIFWSTITKKNIFELFERASI